MNNIQLIREVLSASGGVSSVPYADKLISTIYIIYAELQKVMGDPAMAYWLITYLTVIYDSTPSPLQVTVVMESWLWVALSGGVLLPQFIMIGALVMDDIKDRIWVTLARTSTKSDTSLGKQDEINKKMVEEANGELLRAFTVQESGKDLDRETIDKIVEMAKQGEYDVLGVPVIDRLTRAEPLEAMNLLYTLYDNDVTICTKKHGPFDWNDTGDFLVLSSLLSMSNEKLQNIEEGQNRNYHATLSDRKWPFGVTPPACVEIDGDKRMSLMDGAEEVVPEIFSLYLETGVFAEVKRRINDQLPQGDINSLSESQIRPILENRYFVGEITRNNEVFSHVDEFDIVSEETFDRVQEMISSTSATEEQTWDESIDRVMESANEFARQFGPSYFFLSIIEGFRLHCDDCDSVMEESDTETGSAMGMPVPLFECTGDECDRTRPVPSRDELQQMHQVLPLRCPACPAVGNFSIEYVELRHRLVDYLYKCENCGLEWGCNLCADGMTRHFEHPELGFTLVEEESDEDGEEEDEDQDG